jgi:hypothetical protein
MRNVVLTSITTFNVDLHAAPAATRHWHRSCDGKLVHWRRGRGGSFDDDRRSGHCVGAALPPWGNPERGHAGTGSFELHGKKVNYIDVAGSWPSVPVMSGLWSKPDCGAGALCFSQSSDRINKISIKQEISHNQTWFNVFKSSKKSLLLSAYVP